MAKSDCVAKKDLKKGKDAMAKLVEILSCLDVFTQKITQTVTVIKKAKTMPTLTDSYLHKFQKKDGLKIMERVV